MSPARLLASVALVAVTAGGCTAEKPPVKQPADRGTPVTKFDSAGITLAREPFCDRLTTAAVKRALADDPQQASVYGPGEKAPVTTDIDDVADEYSCTFTSATAEARAWLFAPPVTADLAQTLIQRLRREDGCAATAAAPAFGDPSVALLCRASGRVEASYRGLFGDSWLSCSVTMTDADPKKLADRAGRWCVAVAQAAGS